MGLLLFGLQKNVTAQKEGDPLSFFLCGDVMLGRGIDQVLSHPVSPELHEGYVKNAIRYVSLAERKNGKINYPVDYSYVWGFALDELKRMQPDMRIINLETAITTSSDYWKNKGIHYRMNPLNIDCLKKAAIDFCSLANNHVLDWGYEGLKETLATLKKAGVRYGGAGENVQEATALRVVEIKGKGRVILYSCGSHTSGIPDRWAANKNKAGVNLIDPLSEKTIRTMKMEVDKVRQEGDILVVSIHWGGNWGYSIPASHRIFAHKLIDEVGVDLIHGHSSHHVLGIEVYQHRLILYGCGDFISDYEGIGGKEDFHDELGLMYFAQLEQKTGKLLSLQMSPTLLKHFRVNNATTANMKWLASVLNREGKTFGTSVRIDKENRLHLQW